MATIKSFTSLQQSRKLAEILSLESADMRIGNYVGKSGKVDGTNVHYYPKGESFGAPEIIDAWSLASLLEQIPYEMCDDDGNSLYLEIHKEDNVYQLVYIDPNGITDNIYTDMCEHFVDACVDMVEKLKELNLL